MMGKFVFIIICISFVFYTFSKSNLPEVAAGDIVAEAPAPEVNPTEIKMTAETVRDLGAVIRQNGYFCPEPKMAFAKGMDTFGAVTKVFCGPAGQAGSYPDAVFRVTFADNNHILIEPWR